MLLQEFIDLMPANFFSDKNNDIKSLLKWMDMRMTVGTLNWAQQDYLYDNDMIVKGVGRWRAYGSRKCYNIVYLGEDNLIGNYIIFAERDFPMFFYYIPMGHVRW